MINEHDQVVLTVDLPGDGLLSGDLGTVVSVHKAGKAFTVEFLTLTGRTIAVVVLRAADVRAVTANEVGQARPLVAA